MFLLYITTALAAPNPSPGLVLPAATPVQALDAELSVGASAGWALGGVASAAGAGADLRFGMAPIDGLWVSGSATTMSSATATILGPASDTSTEIYSLASSFSVVRGPRFWTGPVAAAAVVVMDDEVGVLPIAGWSVGGMLGERVAFDGTVAGTWDTVESDAFIALVEAGIRFGATRPHQVRLGLVGAVAFDGADVVPIPIPDASYRFEQDRWYLELGMSGIPVLAQTVRGEVGFRF